MRELLRRIGFHFHRTQYESDLEEEMAHHVAMLEQERGASAAARKQFGNITSLREESRNMWTFGWLEHLGQDLRYALRAMAANPLFTATAALSLALGIGANTAIYGFMNAILMRSLPVPKPEQLVVFEWHAPKRPQVAKSLNGTSHRYLGTGMQSPNFPYAAFENFRANNPALSTLFGYTYVQNFNVIASNQAENISGGYVSGEYFSGLGVPPAAGRLLSSADDQPGAPLTAVLTYPFWQRRYNGDASAIGQSIVINGVPFTIAGVSAPGFFGLDPGTNPMLFLPIHTLTAISTTPQQDARRFSDPSFYWIEMMGRLRPGVSAEQAQAALSAQFHAFILASSAPKEGDTLPEMYLDPGGAGLDTLRRRYSKPIYILMTMVGLILAIACANLANLLLARASARRREMAVRLSLGAGRWRLVRQMLTESIALSLTGGALGLLVALAGIRMITWLLANGAPDLTLRAEVDWHVLGFTLTLSLLAGIVFGLAPAWQATKLDYTPALKQSRTQGAAGTGHRFRPRAGHALIVAQIGVSMLLVVAAGLFVRTLVNLHSIDVGFNRENILLVNLNGRSAGYKEAALARFYAGLLEKFRQIPGVRSASASNFPLVSQYVNENGIYFPGRTHQRDDGTEMLNVDPAFLKTMQIPLVAGRDFEAGDLASSNVAIVNQGFAKKYFPGESPIGRQFQIGNEKQPLLEIVGIARDANYNSLTEQREPVAYLPYTQPLSGLRGLFFEMRTVGEPAGIVSEVRRIVREANREVPISEVTTQAARMDGTISQERTFANLGACFAGLALAIACVGLYGAMAYTVARRTGEIGIRMALGAQRGKIIWMVLREALILTGAGLALGYGAARYSTQVVESFLYGIKANDAGAAAMAAGVLLVAALTASYLPAWRASRIDPARALRNE
jgi:predicted permease